MNCSKQLQRFFSGIVAVTFFVTNTLVPAPAARAANVESPAFISSFTVPSEFGKVTDRVQGPKGGPLLIHIQEAHANYDAQKNIKNILGHLSKNYGVRLMLLEGAGNKLTPELFNFFPQEPELQQAVNEKLMQAGELTGAEAFLMDQTLHEVGNTERDGKKEANAVRRTQDAVLAEGYGVEKAEAYAENREAFRRVFERRGLAQDFLETFYLQWQKKTSLLMSKPLKRFLTQETAFEEGRLPLAEWLASLKMTAARDLKLDLDNILEQKDWPVLVRYFRLKAIDPKIDMGKVEKEREEFLAEINALENGGRKAESIKTGTPSAVKEVMDVFERAKKHELPAYKTRFVFEKLLDRLPEDFSFEAYPNLRLYLQQIILTSELQGDVLRDEMENLAGKLTACLIRTEKDRRLAGTLRDFRLIQKLFELELNRSEYQEILSKKITIESLLLGLRTTDPSLKPGSRLRSEISSLRSLYGTAIRFYEGAIERESWMMKQALARMGQRKQMKAVFITGGFHTEGLKEKALRAGSSYVEITPHIGEVAADSRKNYLAALLGEKAVETSQIAALVRSDMVFLGEVSPGNWRRALASTAARISGILRSVPRMTSDKAYHAASSFLKKAVLKISAPAAAAPAFARSEVRFLSTFVVTKDEKQRIVIPAAWRKDLGSQAELVGLPEQDGQKFRVFPRETWEKKILAERPQDPAKVRAYDDEIYARSVPLKVDRHGRVVLGAQTQHLRSFAEASQYRLEGAGDSFLISPSRSEACETEQTATVATTELPGLTLGLPLDVGAEIRNGAIIESGAFKKAARLLEPLQESFGMGRVYPYNSLFATGDISPAVHQVPNKGEHFLISGNGKTIVMVKGYETKRDELDGLTLRDGSNNFSITSMLKLNPRLSDSDAGPGTSEETEKDVRAFNKKAHSLGIKTMADFIPWLAPDAINEENLDWTFHERLTPGENRHFRSLPEDKKQAYINDHIRETRGAFFAKRMGEGDKEEVVLIRHFPGMGENTYNTDQVLLNIFSPGVQNYYKRSLRYLKELGFDAVRGDMGSYLLKKNLSGFLAAAGLKSGTSVEGDPLQEILQDASMEIAFEAYDPNDQEALIEAGAPSPVAVYNDSFFRALVKFACNHAASAYAIGKVIEETLLYTVRHPGTKKRFLLYPTNFDQNSLNAMAHYPEDLGKGFSVAGVLALSFVTAYLAKEDLGVMLILRDVLGHRGDVRPIVGGDVAGRRAALHGEHAKPFVNTAEELAARTDIEKLERVIREAPAAKFKRELMAAVKGSKQNFIRLLDNANLDRVVSLGWKTEKGEWVVFAVNLRPRQGPMDLRFVEFPVPAAENIPLEDWEAKDALTGELFPIVKERDGGTEFPRILDISFQEKDYRLIVLAPKEGRNRSEVRDETVDETSHFETLEDPGQPFKRRDRGEPFFANINLIGPCNLNCRFCLGYDLQAEFAQYNYLNTHFSEWKNFDAFLKSLRTRGIQKIYLTGQNTDPLLYRYLGPLMDHLKQHGFFVGLRVNGQLATEKMEAINKSDSVSYTVLTLSPRTLEKMAGQGRRKIPDWDFIFRHTKTKMRVSIVVTRENKNEIPELLKFLSQYPNVNYIQLRRTSTDTRYGLLKEDIAAFEDLHREMAVRYPQTGEFEKAPIHDIEGKKVIFWRTVQTTANSWNYFTNGVTSKNYFIIEGYLQNKWQTFVRERHEIARALRPEDYPERYPVPDDKVDWEAEYPSYAPAYYTSPQVLKHGPVLDEQGRENRPDVEDIRLAKVPQESYEGPVRRNRYGVSLNPKGRTGITGRGSLWKWGPNAAVDPIITRLNPQTGLHEMLAVQGEKDPLWRIPGVILWNGETSFQALKRRLGVKIGQEISMEGAIRLYRGYVDDPRNTDNAWLETEVYHLNLPYEATENLELQVGKGSWVKWLPLTDENMRDLYANHGDFVRLAVARLRAETTPVEKEADFKRQLDVLLRPGKPVLAVFDVHGVLLESSWAEEYRQTYHELMGEYPSSEWVGRNITNKLNAEIIVSLASISEKSETEVREALSRIRMKTRKTSAPKALPGALDFVKALSEKNIDIAIVSKTGRADLLRQLEARGFLEYFSSDWIHSGPDDSRQPFHRDEVLQELQKRHPEHTLVLFDDWIDGIATVKKMGGVTFGLPEDGDPVIKDRLARAGVDFILREWNQWRSIYEVFASRVALAPKRSELVHPNFSQRQERKKITPGRSEVRGNLLSEARRSDKSSKEPSWVETNTSRLAKRHVYSRQWECGLPMDLLEKIEALYGAFEAGEISQVTLTGGLGALMPDLFEAWTAIGMNVTGIHPLWNFIKNKPVKGLDGNGARKLLGKIAKEQMQDTGIKFDVTRNVSGSPRTISFRVYKTQSRVHKAPQYYLDAYVTRPDGQENPAFLEVYDDEGKRESDMAFFRDASECLIQTLENDLNPGNVVLLDHEVFVSLPTRYLKKAIRVTLNHTVFRPGLFEAWEGHYELLGFPEWLRSTIVHDGKISIADFTAEVFHLITGVNLVEHLPALLKNIFRTAWHRVIGFYDQAKKIRSTNGVFLPRWQSPERRTLIQRYKERLQVSKPGNRLPPEANDRQFYGTLDQHPDLLERFKAQSEWVSAGDVLTLLMWLRKTRDFKGASDWLGNTFENYKRQRGMDDARLVGHLKEMQELLQKAVREDLPEDWEKLEKDFGEARDAVLADPVTANVRRFVAYKGPDKYEEILAVAAQKATEEAGIPNEMEGKRPFDGRFQIWKEGRDREIFEALRNRLKDQPEIKALREGLCRVLIGGRTFDLPEAHNRFLYIRFLSELLGLEDRIATLEDYTYYEAQIIARGVQSAAMLSDEDLEASSSFMMKVMSNSGEVIGPYAGSNPEVWVIRDIKTLEIIEVLSEKGEPNTSVITQDILRDKLRKKEWEILNGVFVAYDDGEKSTQEGGGRRPSARSLAEALKEVKRLRSDPRIRRERMYRAVSNSWKVDMVTGQAMGHAYLLENTLKEIEDRDAMFGRLQFNASDYAIPMKASDFGWKTDNPLYKHTAKGLGLFGMFRAFHELKTWQQKTPQKPGGDSSTRGTEALNSLKHHAYHGDIFTYLRKNVLDQLSPGLRLFKETIESLAEKAETADDKERISLNLQAMDLTEMLLVRMAGDWFERYMEASPAEAERLREGLTLGVREDYQPWAEYITRYLDGHPDAHSLRTRENKIQSFVFAPAGKLPTMVNLNMGAPIKYEEERNFKGFKARTQVLLDEEAIRQLTAASGAGMKFIQPREPKLGKKYAAFPKGKLPSEINIGVPMPSGIEVIEWKPMRWTQLSEVLAGAGEQETFVMDSIDGVIREMELFKILDAVARQEASAMDSLKQLIRETRVGYKLPEGRVPSDHFFEQLEGFSRLNRERAGRLFGENLKPLMTLIGLFRPDLLKTSEVPFWDPDFYARFEGATREMQAAFGDDPARTNKHHYYVINTSRQSSLVLARKDAQGNAFVITFQFAAGALEAAEDKKVAMHVSEGLTRLIDQGARYLVRDLLVGKDYGERGDLLQGWTLRTPFTGGEDRVQILRLEGRSSAQRSEMRTKNAWPQHEAQKIAVIGTGFVGATKAILLVTDWGHDVVAVDIQPKIVEKLSRGELIFHAPDLQELLTEGLGTGKLKFTTDYAQAIEGREIIFLAVQTPQSETGHANINYLKDSVREIARLIHPGESKIIIGKSTAPPRDTVAALKAVVAEEFQRREAAGEDLQGAALHFAWEPEFLREGKEVEDDRGVAGRVVIGADDRAIAEKIAKLYAHANPAPDHARTEVPIVLTDLTSAPLVKYAANGYRSVKISFVNFVSWLTEKLGLNVEQVAHDIATQKGSQEEDRRVGRAFLAAGLGFGGSCFPKDLASIVQIARGLGVLPGLVLDALAVNELQWRRFVEGLIIPKLKSSQGVQGKTVVVLGASFKPGTDDIRESRAVKVIEELLIGGAKVRVYDPVAVERLRDPRIGPFKDDTAIEYYSDPAQMNAMLEDVDAVVLATEWPAFNQIDFENLRLWFLDHKKELPPIFDGRNFFNEKKINNPESIQRLARTLSGQTPESLSFPYFNIGHGETSEAPSVDHAEFVERSREFFLALRISYINMIAEIAERVGANIRDVKRGLGLDFVVGEEYLAPGIGWGGYKLNAALKAMEDYAKQLPENLVQEFQEIRREIQQKFQFSEKDLKRDAIAMAFSPVPFLGTVWGINDGQIDLYLEKARAAAGGDLRGKVVAVLGLAYKPGVFTTRQSQALNLIKKLLEEGAIVRATDVDQQAITNAGRDVAKMHVQYPPENLTFVMGARTAQENAREAVKGSELQFLVTASPAFANVEPIFFDEKGRAVAKSSRVVDGRHFYDPTDLKEHGIEYIAVGIPSHTSPSGADDLKQAQAEFNGLVSFSEKAVRVQPESGGRILLSLKMKMKPEMLSKLRIFAHFGFYGDESPWQDQEVNRKDIVLLGQDGAWGEYEINAVVDLGKAFPDKTGTVGATFFVSPVPNPTQEARFFNLRFYAGDQSVRDGEFKVETGSTTARSEMRDVESAAIAPTTITGFEQLMVENKKLGGGTRQGFRGVTEKIMDGIWSLTAHMLRAVKFTASFFLPAAQTQEAFNIASAPVTSRERQRFADARKVLLRGATLGDSDALILAPEFAVDRGAALLMRKIAGDVPIAVLVRNDTDRRFLDRINGELSQANRTVIFQAGTLDGARRYLRKTVRGKMNIKPMVFSGEKNLQADLLAQQYGDAVITVTPKMYKSFLNLVGVSEIITKLRNEYLATARSA